MEQGQKFKYKEDQSKTDSNIDSNTNKNTNFKYSVSKLFNDYPYMKNIK